MILSKSQSALVMIADVTFPREIFNDVYFQYLDCNTRTQIYFGGASSGKSYFIISQRLLYQILKGGRNFLIIKKTAKSHRITTYNEIRKSIRGTQGLSKLFKINETSMTITCANGYQILFAGMDDYENIKSITPEKGVITDIIVEEATQLSRDEIKKLKKRQRGISKYKKTMTLLFNPIYLTHWIVEEYFKGKFVTGDKVYHDENLLILKTIHTDNKFLEPEDRAELENETDPYLLSVYTFGNWGVLGGLIFAGFKVRDLSDIRDNFNTYYNGLDFGFTNDPTGIIRTAVQHGAIYITHEAGGHGLTNNVIAERLKPVIGREYVVCDSAEPKSIAELKQPPNSINALGVKKAKGFILHIIQWIKQHEIIVDRSCQNMINELNLYQWAKDKDGNTINKEVDKNNHWIKAWFYALTEIAQTRRGTMSKVRY